MFTYSLLIVYGKTYALFPTDVHMYTFCVPGQEGPVLIYYVQNYKIVILKRQSCMTYVRL